MEKLDFKKLEINDSHIIKKYLKNEEYNSISEYTFTNLFIWQNVRVIQFAEHNDGLILLATEKVKKYFLPPLGYGRQGLITAYLLDYGSHHKMTNFIKRAPLEFINRIDMNQFEKKEDRNNYDYIYLAEDLALLPGRKFSNKRSFIKKFKLNYDFEYLDYDPTMQSECIELAERWFARKNDDKQRCDECNAIKTFLNHYEHFDAPGKVLRINNKVVAFAFGEELNPDTYVIHFEKADTEFIGIYQTINQLFAQDVLNKGYKFINREQDLGIEGIRKAKNSYHPVKMGEKYNIYQKGIFNEN